MGTLKNPVVNFPVNGFAAIIATLLLLLFNFNLSRIYIPVKFFNKPKPVHVTYPEKTEPLEIEDTIDITQDPVAPKRDPNPVNTNPPATAATVPFKSFDGPGDISLTRVNPNIDFRIPHINNHFTPAQVDQKPRVLRPVTPIYPYQATLNGVEGRVVLRFIVDENGEVQNPEVVKAEPEGVFEEAALAAIAKYKFIPAKIGSKNVKSIATMPILFELN
jgi:protein TonB